MRHLKKVSWTLIIFISMLLLSDKVYAENYSNDQIADQAILYDGQWGNQCKEFIRTVLVGLGGTLGSGYRDCYLAIGEEISNQNDVMRGDIIQVSNDLNPDDTEHVHSAIVLENNYDGTFEVIDSNWCNNNCEVVSIHSWNPSQWASTEPNFSAHFYRLGVVNRLNFTFPNHSSQGWTEGNNTKVAQGNDLNTWQVQIIGHNPGIKSPTFSKGMTAYNWVLRFSARVLGNKNMYFGKIWIKDELDSWNNSVDIPGLIPNDHDYHEYEVDFADVYRPTLEIRQFSVELTFGWDEPDEYWALDWVKLETRQRDWDFSDNSLQWRIRQHGRTIDYSDNEWWVITPTGTQPQIESPYLYNLSEDYDAVEIRYALKDENQNQITDDVITRAYFDIGSGFTANHMVEVWVTRDSNEQTVIYEIPLSIRGQVQRVMIDLFDDARWENYQISINEINLTTEDGVGGGICEPTETLPCYYGDPLTIGVGICQMGYNECINGIFDSTCINQIMPQTETQDGYDNDCDGEIDEDFVPPECSLGETQSCYSGPSGTIGVGVCQEGYNTCEDGLWSQTCYNEIIPQTEANDGIDNDCDGEIDEDFPPPTECEEGDIDYCYTGPSGTENVGRCGGGIRTCESGYWSQECIGEMLPGVEIENEIDDDCDGELDENLADLCQTNDPNCVKITCSLDAEYLNPHQYSIIHRIGHNFASDWSWNNYTERLSNKNGLFEYSGLYPHDINQRVFNIQFENNIWWYEGWRTLGECTLTKGGVNYPLEEVTNEYGATNARVVGDSLPEENTTSHTIALWHMDEASGTIVYDATTNQHDATVSGTDINEGISGNARYFNGTINDYLEIEPSSELYPEEMTVSFWMNVEDVLYEYGASPINKYPCCTAQQGWAVLVYQNGDVLVYAFNENEWGVVSAGIITKNQWEHIAFTLNSVTGKLKTYKNGVFQNEITLTYGYNPAPNQPIYIGRSSWGPWEFSGDIDEVRIQSRVLSETEIQTNYSTPVEVVEPFYSWSFEEQSSTDPLIEEDQSSSCNGIFRGNVERINPGKVGRGIRLREDNYIEIINNCDILNTYNISYSISMWFKLYEIPYTYGGALLSKYSGSSNDGIIILAMDNENPYIFARMHDPSSSITVATAIEKNIWNHLTITYDSQTGVFKLYLNGLLSSESAWAGNYTPSSTPIYIGTNSWWTWEIEAEVDELRIFDDALSEEEISLIMNN